MPSLKMDAWMMEQMMQMAWAKGMDHGKGKSKGKAWAGGWSPGGKGKWGAMQGGWGSGGEAKGKDKGKGKATAQRKKRQPCDRPNRGVLQKDPDYSWKSRLSETYNKTHQEDRAVAGTIAYSIDRTDDGFLCTVTADKFSDGHSSAEVMPTSRLAMEEAARIAIENEFPEAYQAISDEAKESVKRKKDAHESGEARENKKTGVESSGDNLKHKLFLAHALLAGRSTQKGDIEFAFEVTDGMTVATVTLNAMGGEMFEGEPCPDKKSAEVSACQQVLDKYAEEIETIDADKQAAKAQKKADFQAKKAAEFAAKRAAP